MHRRAKGALSRANEASEPETWLEQHGDALYRYALLHVRDTALAEDLVQETLLAALGASAAYAGRARLRTWLIGIMKNKIADHLRRSVRETALGDLGEDEGVIDALFRENGHWRLPPGGWPEPEQALDQARFWQALTDCLARLAPRQAQALLLSAWDGLPAAEACKILQATPTNLGVILYRARMHLRACLEVQWGPDERPEE